MIEFILKRAAQPLGLALEWYWEYIILAAAVLIIYKLTFTNVDELYLSDELRDNISVRICCIFSRIFFFLSVWAIMYGAVWLIKLIIRNWKTAAFIACVTVIMAAAVSAAVLIMQLFHSRKSIDSGAHKTKMS
ncbi:MAG: hypothetical protein Q4F95_08720 [Oscillospiraceae bacterium]|nr:hypothetical protein [Oscillospiraceae bacterium]